MVKSDHGPGDQVWISNAPLRVDKPELKNDRVDRTQSTNAGSISNEIYSVVLDLVRTSRSAQTRIAFTAENLPLKSHAPAKILLVKNYTSWSRLETTPWWGRLYAIDTPVIVDTADCGFNCPVCMRLRTTTLGWFHIIPPAHNRWSRPEQLLLRGRTQRRHERWHESAHLQIHAQVWSNKKQRSR